MSNPLPTVPKLSLVVDKVLPPKVRYWVYVVFCTALTVLAVIGKVTQTDADKWISLAGEVLGISGLGLAIANKPMPVDTNNVASFTVAPKKEEGNAGTDR
jgi:hypothetical protein